jgi:hypothetical protein
MIDIKDTQYRAPRTLQQAFGPYASANFAVARTRLVAEYIGYAVAGLVTGVAIAGALHLVFGRW